jgi:hypothetical protein
LYQDNETVTNSKKASHTHRRSQGAATSMEDAITFSVPASEIENLFICTLRAWWIHAHEAAGCHQVGGESHQLPARGAVHTIRSFYGPNHNNKELV